MFIKVERYANLFKKKYGFTKRLIALMIVEENGSPSSDGKTEKITKAEKLSQPNILYLCCRNLTVFSYCASIYW